MIRTTMTRLPPRQKNEYIPAALCFCMDFETWIANSHKLWGTFTCTDLPKSTTLYRTQYITCLGRVPYWSGTSSNSCLTCQTRLLGWRDFLRDSGWGQVETVHSAGVGYGGFSWSGRFHDRSTSQPKQGYVADTGTVRPPSPGP